MFGWGLGGGRGEGAYGNEDEGTVEGVDEGLPAGVVRFAFAEGADVEGDHEGEEGEEDALLDSNATHICVSSAFVCQYTREGRTDVQSNLDLTRLVVSARQHHAARRLDEKDDDIEPDEPPRQRRGSNTPYALIRQPEVDDAADDHVDEGVDPERREENEHLRDDGPARGARIARAHDAEGEAESFPG